MIICISNLVLLCIVSFFILKFSLDSQDQQAQKAISTLKSEQQNEEKFLRISFESKCKAIASIMAENAVGVIESFDYDTLQTMVDNASQDPEIKHIAIFDGNGDLIAGEDCSVANNETFQIDIMSGQDKIGLIHIHRDNSLITNKMLEVSARIETLVQEFHTIRKASINKMTTISIAVSISGLLSLCFTSYILLKTSIVKPLQQLIEDVTTTSNEVNRISSSVSTLQNQWQIPRMNRQPASKRHLQV